MRKFSILLSSVACLALQGPSLTTAMAGADLGVFHDGYEHNTSDDPQTSDHARVPQKHSETVVVTAERKAEDFRATGNETVFVTGTHLPDRGVPARTDNDGTLHFAELGRGPHIIHVSGGRILRALERDAKPALLIGGKTIPLDCSRRTGECVSGPLALSDYDALGRVIFVGGTIKY